MKEKFKNWLENNPIYGVGLLFVSLCMVSFGGAYLGAEMAIDGREVVVRMPNEDIPEKEETE